MNRFGKDGQGNSVSLNDLELAGVVVKSTKPLTEEISEIFEKRADTNALSSEHEVDRLKALRNFLVTIRLIR